MYKTADMQFMTKSSTNLPAIVVTEQIWSYREWNDNNVKKKSGGRSYLRQIYGQQNSVADSAHRKFSSRFSADKYLAAKSVTDSSWGV